MENIHENALKAYGYAFLPHQIKKSTIFELMEVWKQFCAQTLEHKKLFTFESSGGYEYKGPEHSDFKENFHISLTYMPEYKICSSIDKKFSLLAGDFILNNRDIITEALALIIGKENITNAVINNFMKKVQLRFLHYPERNFVEGDLLAIPHVDKGLTIHFTEDAPGFQILWNDQWKDVKVMAGHIIVYPGLLGQYYSKCEFPALCHRVVNTEETAKNGRNSIVMFIDFGDVVYDKATWGKTQETFSKGENYNIPFEEFKKYFTKLENKVL